MQSSTSAQTHACDHTCDPDQTLASNVFIIAEIVDKIATYLDNWSILQFASVCGRTDIPMHAADPAVLAATQALVGDVFSITELVDKIATYLDNWSITQFASVCGCTNMSMWAAKPTGFAAPDNFAWFMGAIMNDNITAVSTYLARFPEHAVDEIASSLIPEVSKWADLGVLPETLIIGAVRIAAQIGNEDMVLAIAPHYTTRWYPAACMKMIRVVEKYFWPDQKKWVIQQSYTNGDFDLLGKLYKVIPQVFTSYSMGCAMQSEYRRAMDRGNRSGVLCAIEYGWLDKRTAVYGTTYLYPEITAAVVEKYGAA